VSDHAFQPGDRVQYGPRYLRDMESHYRFRFREPGEAQRRIDELTARRGVVTQVKLSPYYKTPLAVVQWDNSPWWSEYEQTEIKKEFDKQGQ